MATRAQIIRGPAGNLPVAAQLELLRLPNRCAFVVRHAGRPAKRILDVGCATGYIARLLTEVGHRVTGIELNAQMAEQARSLGIETLEHDLEEPLPLPDESFDVVHACEVIEHLYDTEGLLRELFRVLVPGGVLILSTPNLNSLGNRARVLLGRPLPMWGAFLDDRHGSHIRVFNRAKVVQLLDRTGFRVDVVSGIDRSRMARLVSCFPTFSEMLLIKAVRP